MKKIYLICFASFVVISCGNDNKVSVKKADGNYISKKWEDIKDFFGNASPEKESKKSTLKSKKESGNYISKKWKKTKEIFVDSDSIIIARKRNYYVDLNKKYREFKYVQNWFTSKPKQLQNMQGEFYKMIEGTTVNNETVSYTDLASKSPQGTYKYLFISENAYYIFDLSLTKDKIKCLGVRRIKKGYGSESIHDLVFDTNGNLKQEVYQGDVKQDLFTKDGHIFFEFEKEYEGGSVTNTIDLGIERKF